MFYADFVDNFKDGAQGRPSSSKASPTQEEKSFYADGKDPDESQVHPFEHCNDVVSFMA